MNCYLQVAECLGKLCLLEPKDLLPHLKEFLKSPEPLTRTTAVTAVKFTISDQVKWKFSKPWVLHNTENA